MNSIEFCAGAGGQALGLEQAGFDHEALVEIDRDCVETLRLNRPQWDVRLEDMSNFDGKSFKGVDLFAGGLPCPPFSLAGKQLGESDERNLFPAAFRLIAEMQPKAVMIENVRGFLSPVFSDYRNHLKATFHKLGFEADWKLFNASDYGVSQLRPRVVIVALRHDIKDMFDWPVASKHVPLAVGDKLGDLMAANGWEGAEAWAAKAREIAPTIVGGSKKHGGPDLGPTRARAAWAAMGVEGRTIAETAPEPGFTGMPRLTTRMVARLQGFPDSWQFHGRKTAAYRQIGNAFPPPVAAAVARNLRVALACNRSFAVQTAA
jgi:DNA (cytosine-5)-methyltransferase 1